MKLKHIVVFALDYTPLIFSTISTIIAASSFLFSYQRASKTDVANNENRITKIEGNQFTQADRDRLKFIEDDLKHCRFSDEDRKCLYDNTTKMALFWGIVQTEFPKILKQFDTPKLDKVFDKLINCGIRSLSIAEAKTFHLRLQTEYDAALKAEKADRALILALYNMVYEYETSSIRTGAENKLNSALEKTERDCRP